MLSVSEVGIVTDNVNDTSNKLVAKYDLQFFSKQPPLPDFTVLGDNNGLFIIVQKDRAWYPTDKKSSVFYTKVIFEDKGQLQEFELT
ncbi:hypothetical protein D3C71_2028190 [compost metagenome]